MLVCHKIYFIVFLLGTGSQLQDADERTPLRWRQAARPNATPEGIALYVNYNKYVIFLSL